MREGGEGVARCTSHEGASREPRPWHPPTARPSYGRNPDALASQVRTPLHPLLRQDLVELGIFLRERIIGKHLVPRVSSDVPPDLPNRCGNRLKRPRMVRQLRRWRAHPQRVLDRRLVDDRPVPLRKAIRSQAQPLTCPLATTRCRGSSTKARVKIGRIAAIPFSHPPLLRIVCWFFWFIRVGCRLNGG